MPRTDFLFTSESVTEGHPDKMADQISDAILDAVFACDPMGRVACETFLTTGLALVAGEITTDCYADIPSIVRETIKDIGYTHAKYGFDYQTCAVLTSIHPQSPDIALGVNPGGAGDQGLMFGYATDETEELMPMPVMLAHKLAMRLAEVRKKRIVDYLRPDGKSQVTVRYKNGTPVEANTIVISTQHGPEVNIKDITEDVVEHVIEPVIAPELRKNTKYYVNPTGRFVMGGPSADTGLTGRKIIVDTYGGVGSHGGGAFSGKDPSKVDRSGSYMARYIAKNIVAAGLAKKCEVQMAYAIGVAEPVSLMIDAFQTGKVSYATLKKAVREVFDLTPNGMIKMLDLRRPIYKKTAAYGHFGRNDPDFTWEKTDKVDDLLTACKVK
ncbi:MAG: methionine adenosyltransferase [Candidatus Coatesbacteria bacterium]|nr:MAG: methionine adenosyltransferase [Candidatus Coatesbacteria bacterium]